MPASQSYGADQRSRYLLQHRNTGVHCKIAVIHPPLFSKEDRVMKRYVFYFVVPLLFDLWISQQQGSCCSRITMTHWIPPWRCKCTTRTARTRPPSSSTSRRTPGERGFVFSPTVPRLPVVVFLYMRGPGSCFARLPGFEYTLLPGLALRRPARVMFYLAVSPPNLLRREG